MQIACILSQSCLLRGYTLPPWKHCLVAFGGKQKQKQKTHSERSSPKYLNSQWWRVFHLNPGVYKKPTHSSLQGYLFSPPVVVMLQNEIPGDLGLLLAQWASPLPRRQGGEGGDPCLSPAPFLNLNNICSLEEGCERDIGSRAGPKKPGREKTPQVCTSLGWKRAYITGFKSIFFSFTSHNPLDEN